MVGYERRSPRCVQGADNLQGISPHHFHVDYVGKAAFRRRLVQSFVIRRAKIRLSSLGLCPDSEQEQLSADDFANRSKNRHRFLNIFKRFEKIRPPFHCVYRKAIHLKRSLDNFTSRSRNYGCDYLRNAAANLNASDCDHISHGLNASIAAQHLEIGAGVSGLL